MEKRELTIFEGPICCPTGICGPATDPVMIELNETLRKLGENYRDLKITRASMSFDVALFMQTPLIRDLVRKNGVGILPVTLIDGHIVKQQEYPKYAEIVRLLNSER